MTRGRDTWRAAGDAAQCGADLVPVDQRPHPQHHHAGAAGGRQHVMAPSLLVLVPGGAHCQQDGGQSGGSEDTLPDIRGVPRFPVCSDRQGLQSLDTAGQSSRLNYLNVKTMEV